MAISLASCRFDDFPSAGTYETILKNCKVVDGVQWCATECALYPIVKEDPLTFGKGYRIACPKSTFGFHYKEVPGIMDWIRERQGR